MDTEEEAPIRAPQQVASADRTSGTDQTEDPTSTDQTTAHDDRPAIATATDVALEQDA